MALRIVRNCAGLRLPQALSADTIIFHSGRFCNIGQPQVRSNASWTFGIVPYQRQLACTLLSSLNAFTNPPVPHRSPQADQIAAKTSPSCSVEFTRTGPVEHRSASAARPPRFLVHYLLPQLAHPLSRARAALRTILHQ